MDIHFRESVLDRMETDPTFSGGLSPADLYAYRSRIQALRAAPREQALLKLHSFELRGRGNGKHTLRVTDDWDLHVGFEGADGARIAVVETMVQRTKTKTEPSL